MLPSGNDAAVVIAENLVISFKNILIFKFYTNINFQL